MEQLNMPLRWMKEIAYITIKNMYIYKILKL